MLTHTLGVIRTALNDRRNPEKNVFYLYLECLVLPIYPSTVCPEGSGLYCIQPPGGDCNVFVYFGFTYGGFHVIHLYIQPTAYTQE